MSSVTVKQSKGSEAEAKTQKELQRYISCGRFSFTKQEKFVMHGEKIHLQYKVFLRLSAIEDDPN